MKTIILGFLCLCLFACGDKPKTTEADNSVKQLFTLSQEPQTKSNNSDTKIQQPFSLTSEPQTQSSSK